MKKLKLFGVFTGKELLEDLGFNYNMTVIPNAKYELWYDGLFVKKTVSVRNKVELK
jgi:hypothetical protein